jgi:hypothetical protein
MKKEVKNKDYYTMHVYTNDDEDKSTRESSMQGSYNSQFHDSKHIAQNFAWVELYFLSNVWDTIRLQCVHAAYSSVGQSETTPHVIFTSKPQYTSTNYNTMIHYNAFVYTKNLQ